MLQQAGFLYKDTTTEEEMHPIAGKHNDVTLHDFWVLKVKSNFFSFNLLSILAPESEMCS